MLKLPFQVLPKRDVSEILGHEETAEVSETSAVSSWPKISDTSLLGEPEGVILAQNKAFS